MEHAGWKLCPEDPLFSGILEVYRKLSQGHVLPITLNPPGQVRFVYAPSGEVSTPTTEFNRRLQSQAAVKRRTDEIREMEEAFRADEVGEPMIIEEL